MRLRPVALILAAGLAPAAELYTFQRAARADAVVEIDAGARADWRIPRTIYGTFLEPIGRSIYGGLWAQLLVNPSFEDNLWSAPEIRRMLQREPKLEAASDMGLPLPWEPLAPDQGYRYEPRWKDAANSSRSLFIMALPEKQTGVRQQVYLPIHRTLRYRGSLWAKHFSGPPEVEVSLRRRNQADAMLARAAITLRGAAWTRYEFTLALDRGQLARLDPADFAIAVRDEARVLVDQALLFPDDAVEGMDPEMIAMSRALKTPVVRYGGNFTSGYHWRDGIGPLDQRPTMLNQAWGMPEYNHFGTDELLAFCRLIGAEPQIALNLGSGTPEEAADWVRYVNARWGEKRGGLLWELGNELWGSFQIGYPTLARVAERTRLYSEAVRRAEPRARLIATGQDPDHFREWNAAQLAIAPAAFEYLATHFVVGMGGLVSKEAPRDFTAMAGLALPVELERRLRQMKAQIDGHPEARGKVRLAFTEWLFHGRRNVPFYDNMGGALCTAGFLNTLLRVADFVPIADMTGLIEFGGIWKKRGQVYGVPAYWAFRMYSTADAAVPVRTSVTADAYDVHQGVRRLPEIDNVPYLDVVAALNEARDRLTLFCVNRHLQSDIAADVRVTGFRAATARIQVLKSASIYDENGDVRPDAVMPAESMVTVKPAVLAHTFPRASVTVIELRAR